MIQAITKLISLIIITSSILFSQTYYVDYTGGSNSNNGISEATAFKHCPGDPSASGTAAGITLQPGDVVIFKGGVKYLGQVLVNVSGTSSNYITYKGSLTWGTGKPIFDMQNTRSYGFKSTSARHYIRIEGIEFFNYNYGGDHVMEIGGGSTYWRIDNCAFGFMEAWANDEKHPVVSLKGGQSYIYFTYCEFFKSGHYTLKLQNSDHIYVQHCNFGGKNRGTDKGWVAVPLLVVGSSSYTYIQDNVFHDYWMAGGDQNPELHHSPDLIHTYGIAGIGNPSHIYIERNYFYNDHQFNTGSGTGDMSISTNSTFVYIRNNVFVNSCNWWGATVIVSNGADNVWIENNTFIMRDYLNPSAVYGLKVYVGGGETAGPNIYIYNNIFYNDDDKPGSTCIEFFGGGTFQGESDYNTFYSIRGDGGAIGWNGLKTLAEWQTTGNDANSVYDNDGSNIFMNFPTSPENSSSGDYSLNLDYAGNQIDKGIPRNDYNDSYDGTIRPQGNGWDIGAYEIQSGPDTTPPELQGANINNPTQVKLFFSEALDPQSAENESNYSIDNGISVISAVLNSNNRDVILTTTEHTSTQQYTVTVSNVTDAAGNTIDPQANSAQYLFEADLTPPQLMSAFAIISTQVTLFFSETLDSQSAQNVNNYNINNGISVINAVINSSNTDVTLTTSAHDTNQTYTATVSNVTDLSGNVISPNNNSADYQIIIISDPIFPIDLFGTP
ncbi:MAG: Ig-like domain-containing protein, partial [Candidatus Kariarchaeaceae archaeon]